MSFVVARTSSGRPSLQHFTEDHEVTACGRDITMWSRAYQRSAIKEIYCMKCNRAMADKKRKRERTWQK